MSIAEVTEAATTTDWVSVARRSVAGFAATVAERERAGEPPHAELQAVRAAGLTNLLIPREHGGEGATHVEAAAVVSELSALDPNVGGLLAYHFTNFIPDLLDYDGGNAELQRASAAGRWLWGNVTQPFVPFRATPTPEGGYVLNGVKPLNTGALTGDLSTVLAPRTDERSYVYVAVPRDREGQTFHDDWDHLGLRRTATVTIEFRDVVVKPEEVYADSHPGPRDSFPPFYEAPGGLFFASILVGAAQGALRTALGLVRGGGEPPPATAAELDPEALSLLGRLSARVQAAVALRDEVAAEIADGFARRRELEVEEIVALKQRSETLRLFAAGVGLEVGTEVLELPGVAAGRHATGIDRYWRDVRIHSLHLNPPIYHHRIVGDVLLNGSRELGPRFYGD
ncbi:acyl-CoA dehydrogenase family protein [Conexibacter arvalis]|uniref:Alkylation response protein AidB-like acyl-CoA dehydrogenase n=1 Tax=Conexibacter arvalis TaxID=912552 RepID=A0A840ID57_9ACTN|nr:acyl-CoA dehydrogenase family protein [Conexibacter arvalis]MBB4662181.1 alkylation response protein AidB-like acyl-CoA dehydrogenase [Conexibacter arvalis]